MSSTDPRSPAGTPHGEPDPGRHAVERPAPTPPAPAGWAYDRPEHRPPTAGVPSSAAPTPGAAPGDPRDERAPAAAPAPAPAPTAPPAPPPVGVDDELFPDGHTLRTPHAGSHVLGVLVGLLLGPVVAGLLLLGQSRVLVVQVDGWDASLELLGIVLVSAGVVLAALVLVCGLWTAAVPVTAGLVVGAVGGVQLYAPGIARMATLDALGDSTWQWTVVRATVAGTSGTTFTVGVLLLTAGVVVALARRRGVRLGAFRERNRTP